METEDEGCIVEATCKKQRGRPTFESELIEKYRSLDLLTAKTKRGAQNNVYYYRALRVLRLNIDQPEEQRKRLSHIVDWEASERGVRGAVKHGVLVELGRIATRFDEGTALSFAMAANDAFADGSARSVRDAESTLRKARLKLVAEGRDKFRRGKQSVVDGRRCKPSDLVVVGSWKSGDFDITNLP